MDKRHRLLQINVGCNWGSTGRIACQLGEAAAIDGWESHIIYGRSYNPSTIIEHKVATSFSVYEHYFEHRFFDNDGLASRLDTKRLVSTIKGIQPDIIHLHNIHDHWLNYEIFFKYLSTLDIPVVWTQHDCWCFTGGCGYFSMDNCEKWKTQCRICPKKQGLLPFVEQTKKHFEKKKFLFNQLRNLTLVPVSKWLEGLLRESFLKNQNIKPILNGIDIEQFRIIPSDVKERFFIKDKFLLVGSATTWSVRKGFQDYVRLSKLLPKEYQILLVGVSNNQLRSLPSNIIGIPRTQNLEELVGIYSGADIILNLSYEETFGLTTVEGFGCGTPSIVYNCTASPELITPETGIIVSPGDVKGVLKAIFEICEKGKMHYSRACRARATQYYNKNDRYKDYLNLYDSLLVNK